MKRVKMIVSYDGTDYCGWQIQMNGITVEEELNKALSELLNEPVVVIGASRTDSGVHAEGNVAVFDTENRMAADRICFALNQRLPEDVRVLRSEEVPLDWHPRKQNCVKTYEYKILNRKINMPTLRLYAHFCYVPLDVEKMREAAAYLVGEHDFRSFSNIRTQTEDTVRTIYSLEVDKQEDMITIRIRGSGFLYNMVRIIAGTLMKVGAGVYPPEHMEEIIDARNRQAAGQTALAKGLTLIGLEYETELKDELTGENKEWKYRLIQTEIQAKKKAYIVIDRCVPDEYDRLLARVTHQAVRNGARQIFVCDREQEGRIVQDKHYGYYQFRPSHGMLKMSRSLGGEVGSRVENRVKLSLVPMENSHIPLCCRLFNEVFFKVPNSAAMTEEELKERLERKEELLYLVQCGDAVVGFALLIIKEEQELEIDSLGIASEFRNQGLARLTLQEIEALAAELGLEKLGLMVADSNIPAYTLYQKSGFQVTGVHSRWYRTAAFQDNE